MMSKRLFFTALILAVCSVISCSRNADRKAEEQIEVSTEPAQTTDTDSLMNSIAGNATMKQLATFPNRVILTGLKDHRLVSIYKSKAVNNNQEKSVLSRYSSYPEESGNEGTQHFMPGMDILFGYNLLNLAHYDLKTERGNFLFSHPVLIKTLYFPSFIQDSLDKKPVNRNFYLVSVYDEDTNKDSLINKKDLRRFYLFDAACSFKKPLIPADYSVVRSQYDPDNDIMYLFARHDDNHNGSAEKTEPVHIFWFGLKTPDTAKLLY